MGRAINTFHFIDNRTLVTPTPDMIPELILLGTLEKQEIMLDSGRLMKVDVIAYEGKEYIMKVTDGGHWRDKRYDE